MNSSSFTLISSTWNSKKNKKQIEMNHIYMATSSLQFVRFMQEKCNKYQLEDK